MFFGQMFFLERSLVVWCFWPKFPFFYRPEKRREGWQANELPPDPRGGWWMLLGCKSDVASNRWSLQHVWVHLYL